MGTNPLLSEVATMAEELAKKLQDESLVVRKELFFDPKLGFNHNLGGLRTTASRKKATEKVNAITNGAIVFHFVSHRSLWFQAKGVDKRYMLNASNKHQYGIEDSTKMNPYRKIANELKKAAKEWKEMDEMYQLLKAA